jgi:two-component system cell cycle sensor histidine kinase/response regulator CckA
LRDSGYTVWEADRPTAAFGILEKEQPIDLLLVDFAMPEMNGLEVMKRARNHHPELKLLLVTGHPDALHAGDMGAPVLAKPFTIGQLKERVAESLSG